MNYNNDLLLTLNEMKEEHERKEYHQTYIENEKSFVENNKKKTGVFQM